MWTELRDRSLPRLLPPIFAPRRRLKPAADREPLRVMFVISTMPVGGAETLLVQIIRRLDRTRFAPELCCLKYFDELGGVMAREVPAYSGLLAGKYDLRVLPRLVRLLCRRRIDAVITVGTGGDKMFWGRLAARLAGVPVIASALHSTGLPDHVEFLNRQLVSLTDAFIAVAQPHGRYLAEHEGCPAAKVCVIPNGVDTERFRPRAADQGFRQALKLPADAPTVAIVAALRPEKNHELFLRAAALVHEQLPEARMLVIGNGVRRAALAQLSTELGLANVVRFLGTRHDVPEILSQVDVVALTSHMEASPVSILEAMACAKPVVATRVGSVPENVCEGQTGYLVEPGDAHALAERLLLLLRNRQQAAAMGAAGWQHVREHGSIEGMVRGYEELIATIYSAKAETPLGIAAAAAGVIVAP